MAHYVISDLHGEIELFHAMLEKIGFSGGDTLYILGDVFDRGPAPIPLLREIMVAPNMRMLLGNHEYMCLQYHAPDASEKDIRRWNRNNNIPTLSGLSALQPEERAQVFSFLRSLPAHLEVTVGERRFYLVHGFPADTPEREVWDRPEPDTPAPLPGYTVIVGHTPICWLGREDPEAEEYNRELEAAGTHMMICHAPGFIDLDCGAGYDFPVRALACLRLEDMAEFYVR